MRKFNNTTEFEWDRGNHNKNWLRHKVTNEECEEAFFDPERKIYKDDLHSKSELRSLVLGQTKKGRLLFISFTKRGTKIRVVSARVPDKREQKLYF